MPCVVSTANALNEGLVDGGGGFQRSWFAACLCFCFCLRLWWHNSQSDGCSCIHLSHRANCLEIVNLLTHTSTHPPSRACACTYTPVTQTRATLWDRQTPSASHWKRSVCVSSTVLSSTLSLLMGCGMTMISDSTTRDASTSIVRLPNGPSLIFSVWRQTALDAFETASTGHGACTAADCKSLHSTRDRIVSTTLCRRLEATRGFRLELSSLPQHDSQQLGWDWEESA
jgi:hypothetical protein